jgi:ER lumen protein retaining receptor
MDIVLWIFVCGYFFQMLATSLLIYKIWKQKSIYGLCWDTQLIFLFGSVSRCIWLNETRLKYLPFAHFELYSNTLLLLLSVYLCFRFRYTCIHKAPEYLNWITLTIGCFILSFFFHPGVKNQYYLSSQMLVSFTMFSESAGLLPQFIIMRKAKEVEGMTGQYLIFLGSARLCRLIFWIQMYASGDTFLSLIAADLIHTIILADFSVIYFKSVHQGKRILLP